MKIKVLKVVTGELVGAQIKTGDKIQLPSMQTGWRFNFDKHSQLLAHAETYVLITDETPDITEACLIFQMINNRIPYMAFLEVAPHNRLHPKRYDFLAGCLIAYAFRLSVIKGKGDYKAQLFFDVQETNREDERKLIQLYRKKYGALHIGGTRLLIIDDAGYALIEKYLGHGNKV